MRYFMLPLQCIMFLLLAASLQAADASPPLTPASALLTDIKSALEKIRTNSPVYYHQLELKLIAEKKVLTEKILSEISSAVEISEKNEPPAPLKSGQLLSARISHDRILYLRIDFLHGNVPDQAAAELEKVRTGKSHFIGIILDLRGARGNTPEDARKLFSCLSVSLPVLVLTDSETAGSPEILAKLLEHTRYGLCIGEKTKGIPFPLKKIVSGEYTFYVPLIPEDLMDMAPEAVIPAIPAQGQPRMTMEQLQKNGSATEKNDPALRRACDLLLSLETVNKKWRK